MSKHSFTPIPCHQGYVISTQGKVFSVSSNWRGYGFREMSQSYNSDGYPSVRLTKNGKRKRIAVHKLLALAFLPPRPSLRHQIRHLDGNKLNATSGNLAWGTPRENAEDREKHGHTSRGVEHSIAVKKGQERIGYNVKW
jgi:hypothetical protein